MYFHFKERFISLIWFGLAAFLAVYLMLGKAIFNNKQLLFYLIPWIVCIGSLMGFFYGYRVLVPVKNKGLLSVLKIGFLGGLFSLILFDVGILVFINSLMYMACHAANTCQKDFQGSFLFDLKTLGVSLFFEGWAAVLVGMFAASALYLIKPRIK